MFTREDNHFLRMGEPSSRPDTVNATDLDPVAVATDTLT
jgi:hypothetical protein